MADRIWSAGEPLEGRGMVLIEGGRIAAVDSAGHAPTDASTVDFGDATILPGLIDAHTHLCFDCTGEVLAPMLELDDDSLLEEMHERARAALAVGVTTVRDLGDRRFISLRLRERLRDRPSDGSEVIAAGPPITRRRGHCWFLGGEAETPDELRAAVFERSERGCDVVKVMATGGVITPGFLPHESQYGLHELQAIVDAAHAAGLPVAAHAHGVDGIRDAVAAGADSIEHCSFGTETSVEVDWAVVEEMASRGTFASFTMAVRPGGTPPPAVAARLPLIAHALVRLNEVGVKVACSSDAGIAPQKPHDVLPYGVVSTAELIGANDALTSVTATAADMCGVGDRKGRLRPGFDADVLVVGGDVVADPSAIFDVRAVYRAGVAIEPTQ